MAPITVGKVAISMSLDNCLPKGPCQWTEYQMWLGQQSYKAFCGIDSALRVPYSAQAEFNSPGVLLSGSAIRKRYARSPHAMIHSLLRKLRRFFCELSN